MIKAIKKSRKLFAAGDNNGSDLLIWVGVDDDDGEDYWLSSTSSLFIKSMMTMIMIMIKIMLKMIIMMMMVIKRRSSAPFMLYHSAVTSMRPTDALASVKF